MKLLAVVLMLAGWSQAQTQTKLVCYHGEVDKDGNPTFVEIDCSKLPVTWTGELTITGAGRIVQPRRSRVQFFALAATEAVAVVSDVYDTRRSEAAFNRGYVETEWPFAGTRPSAAKLYGFNLGLELPLASVPSILGYVLRKKPWFYGGLTAPLAFAGHHFYSGANAP